MLKYLTLSLALIAAPVYAETSCKVSAKAFQDVELGMTYETVASIIGCRGEVMSESAFMDTHMVMYSWSGNSAFSMMNAMFTNNRLTSKSQFGLE